MAYPRQCPLCDAAYGPSSADDARHATVRAEPGGTPNPRFPELPGRLCPSPATSAAASTPGTTSPADPCSGRMTSRRDSPIKGAGWQGNRSPSGARARGRPDGRAGRT